MLNIKQSLLPILLGLLVFSTGCVPNNYTFSNEYGKSGSGDSEFLNPTDMDINSRGDLVIADSGNTRFQIISTSGKFIGSGGGFGVDKNKLQSIAGLCVDKSTDEIWVCDPKGNKVVKYGKDGNAILKVTKNMKAPMDVAVDENGNILVLMTRSSELYKYDNKGDFIEKIGGQPKLIFPTSIIIKDKIAYVADFGGKKIVKFDLDGKVVGEINKKGDYEEMKGPSSLHIDDQGNIYILDLGEVPVVIISSEGKFISQIGKFGNQKGNFLYPTGVIAKSPTDVFILDNSRNTVLNFRKKS